MTVLSNTKFTCFYNYNCNYIHALMKNINILFYNTIILTIPALSILSSYNNEPIWISNIENKETK